MRRVDSAKPEQLDDVIVRRLKADVRELVPGEFAKRVIEPLVIDGLPPDAPELDPGLLQQLREARVERLASTTKGRRTAAMLVLTSLQKRLLSSIEALHRTRVVHQKAIERRSQQRRPRGPSRPRSPTSRCQPPRGGWR